MNVRLRSALPLFVCGALALSAPAAYAAPINYGDFGPDFPPGVTIYVDVQESSGTDPDLPDEFGAPYIYGDILDFDPTIVAWSGDGAADVTDGQLNFELMVLERRVVAGGMSSLLISGSGDFSLFGAGTATSALAASVSVNVDILEVDGIPITPISVFASNSMVRDLVTDGPVVLAPWDNGVLLEFAPILVANNVDFSYGVTRAKVVLNNQLIANSETDSVVFVANKQFTIAPGIVPNPNFKSKP